MKVTAADLALRLDALLGVAEHPDFPQALNGLQVDHRGPVHGIAAAVDFSTRTVEATAAAGANLLIVHHGMFWGGPQRIVGSVYRRYRLLIENDIAVYSAHLPLDSHPDFGNNALLARELGLVPDGRFTEYQGKPIGVCGSSDLNTDELCARVASFVSKHGGTVRMSETPSGRRTRRWAVCTGAGASTETLRLAEASGVDTLVVGEGPHHTAVEAPERGVVVIYAGHYATETPGVAAIAAFVAAESGIPWQFVGAPTGL